MSLKYCHVAAFLQIYLSISETNKSDLHNLKISWNSLFIEWLHVTFLFKFTKLCYITIPELIAIPDPVSTASDSIPWNCTAILLCTTQLDNLPLFLLPLLHTVRFRFTHFICPLSLSRHVLLYCHCLAGWLHWLEDKSLNVPLTVQFDVVKSSPILSSIPASPWVRSDSFRPFSHRPSMQSVP